MVLMYSLTPVTSMARELGITPMPILSLVKDVPLEYGHANSTSIVTRNSLTGLSLSYQSKEPVQPLMVLVYLTPFNGELETFNSLMLKLLVLFLLMNLSILMSTHQLILSLGSLLKVKVGE